MVRRVDRPGLAHAQARAADARGGGEQPEEVVEEGLPVLLVEARPVREDERQPVLVRQRRVPVPLRGHQQRVGGAPVEHVRLAAQGGHRRAGYVGRMEEGRASVGRG